MGFWKKLKLGMMLAAEAEMLAREWDGVEAELLETVRENPRLLNYYRRIQDLVRQVKRLL